jgi:predicted dehydrogenase
MVIIQDSKQFITSRVERRIGETRVGVIGCGYWGPNLIRNFNESPKSKLVAVADLRQERLDRIQTSYPKVSTFTDYHELFYQDLDAIVIATPPATHYSIATEVLENGMHAFIEKPMTLQSGHARELIDLAQRLDLVLMVGHAFEYNVAVQKLKALIDSGEIGAIRYIDSARLNLGLYQNGTNVLWDLAPHDISILCYILGMEPLSVTAQGARCISKNICDVVYMNLMFPENILAHIHVSWLDPYKVRRVTVVGSKKMAIFNDVESDKIKIIDKGVNTPAETNTFAEFQYSYRNGDVLMPYLRMEEPLRVETEHFIDCINNHSVPRSNGEDGLRVVRVLEAAQRSLENCSQQEMVDHE